VTGAFDKLAGIGGRTARVTVYCGCDPDDRFVVVGYMRLSGNWVDWRFAERDDDDVVPTRQVRRAVSPGDDRPDYEQFRFHCSRCGFNEIRRAARRDDRASLFAVFDKLAAAGVGEIEVRDLVRLAW